MLRRLIIFLVRRKLGVKKYQVFRFKNQKSETDTYYFASDRIWKHQEFTNKESSVSLNWLLSNGCEIEIIE